jgi:hypothetical protein
MTMFLGKSVRGKPLMKHLQYGGHLLTAREAAVFRGRESGIPLSLGSSPLDCGGSFSHIQTFI